MSYYIALDITDDDDGNPVATVDLSSSSLGNAARGRFTVSGHRPAAGEVGTASLTATDPDGNSASASHRTS